MKVLSSAAVVMALEHRTTNAFQALAPSRTGRVWAPRQYFPPRSSTWISSSSGRRRRATGASTLLYAAQTSSDVTETASMTPEGAAKKQNGHGQGRNPPKPDKKSFVQWDMRRAAMKLHTRDQAPKEGKQENKGDKFSEWKPSRRGYLQFLVDSKVVYETLEEACASESQLVEFRETGLERSAALAKDISWMVGMYPDALPEGGVGGKDRALPPPTETALEYATFLRETVASSLPAFMCHYYNHYFAHTAGGRMIGRKVAENCLDGRTLEFYQWGGCDVKVLLEAVRMKIDTMAKGWNDDEKQACVAETPRTFEYGGRLLSSITS